MQVRRLGTLFVAALALCVTQAAAQTDPVNEQYQAYTSALERGDRAAAETAAAAALAASEARDGDGGRTAVLAFNLAQLRLDINRDADAYAPAQRAQQIASRNANAGVSPILAELVLGRTELAQPSTDGRRRITRALESARGNPDLALDAYEAALDVGDWDLRQGRGREAVTSFQTAASFVSGDTDTARLLRARAEMGRGVALESIDNRGAARSTGTRVQRRPNEEAAAALVNAIRWALPTLRSEPSVTSITRAQSTYGTALAWAHNRNERLRQLGWPNELSSEDGALVAVDLNAGDGLPACGGKLDPELNAAFGSETLLDGGMGAVVVRSVVDSSGNVTDARVVGAAATAELMRAVNAAARNWRIVGDGEGCSRQRIMFTPIVFTVARDFNMAVSGNQSVAPNAGMGQMPSSGMVTSTPFQRTWISGEDRTVIAYVPG